MIKILHVATREFLSTVMTKGFILGFFLPLIILGLLAVLFPLLLNEDTPKVTGRLDVMDRSGVVIAGIREELSPEKLAEKRAEETEAAAEMTKEITEGLGGAMGAGMPGGTDAMLEKIMGEIPEISILELPDDADLEAQKLELTEGERNDGGPLALAIIAEDAVVKGVESDGFGSYELFVRSRLDDRVQGELRSAISTSIRNARIEAAGLDPQETLALTWVERPDTKEITEEGEERDSNEILNILLPMAYMMLLLMGVFTGGQYLMTTVVEEKSSRVIEVLLSAVSPMQLMTGKILGQMAVSFLLLIVYAGLGISSLVFFALTDMIDPLALVYMLIFFVIAYFTIASFMAAIGSAVSEMREAQSLLAPVMIVLMIPYMLWLPITRDPNGIFATVCSFVPPINTFVMMLRVVSTEPPPHWQVWLSIAVGAATMYASLWAAAKVFRVGILMFGKPPNLLTLLKWIRMA